MDSVSFYLGYPSSKWKRGALRPPGKCTGFPIMVNDNEFVLPIGEYQMVKYNARRNEWSLFLTMEKALNFEKRTVAIDTNTKRMYLSGAESDITVVDLEKESIIYEHRRKWCHGFDAGLFIVHGVVHKFGGFGSNDHVVWSDLENKWSSPRTDNPLKYQFDAIWSRSPFLLHVESKGIFLMFGAHTFGTSGAEALSVGMWQFNVAFDRWEEQIHEDIEEGAFVVSADEQFVVILDDPIKVLDMRKEDEWKIWESSVRPPFVGIRAGCGSPQDSPAAQPCLLARSGGGADSVLLAYGWIRTLFGKQVLVGKSDQTENCGGCDHIEYELPPAAIIGVIADFCAQGMIHWLASGPQAKRFKAGLDHQIIPMSEILRGIDDDLDCKY